MARLIVPNTFTSQGTEYFSGFTPYRLDSGLEGTDLVSEMVTYSILPLKNPTTINQEVGASDTYSFEVAVKNITQNIILDVEIETDKYFTISTNSFALSPLEVNKFIASVNNNEINASQTPLNFSSSVVMRITNRDNKIFAIKNINVEEFEELYIDQDVLIT